MTRWTQWAAARPTLTNYLVRWSKLCMTHPIAGLWKVLTKFPPPMDPKSGRCAISLALAASRTSSLSRARLPRPSPMSRCRKSGTSLAELDKYGGGKEMVSQR